MTERARAIGKPSAPPTVLTDLRAIDHAVYAAVATTDAPTIDRPLRLITKLADHSLIWWGVAALLAIAGGTRGRRAALSGAAALGATSVVQGSGLKRLGRRRPDRERVGVPTRRHVTMPATASFPSGHAAAAFAFTNAVGTEVPALALPLRALALAVAYSRVHTGVHYPSDVMIGGIVGGGTGQLVASALHRWYHRRGRIS